MRNVMLATFALAVVATTQGCSKKPQECRQIVNIIDDDDQAAQVAAAGMSSPDGQQFAKAATDLAAAEDKVAADLGALTITSPDVKKGSDDYIALAKDASAALKKNAAPIAQFSGNLAAGTDPFTRITDAVKKLVDRCVAVAADEAKQGAKGGDATAAATDKKTVSGCVQILALIQNPPANSDNPATEADALNAWLKLLQGVAINDKDVQSDASALESVVQDNIAFDQALSSLVTSFNQFKVRADQVTGEINTACGAQ
jgi:hypothetical protein